MRMEYNTLILEKIDHNILKMTLNRPQSSNAMSEELLSEFAIAVHEISNDKSSKVLIITGAGRNFCAGGDLGMVQRLHEQGYPELRAFFQNFHRALIRLQDMEKLVIASVNGAAAGAGCDLALSCDLRIASASAKFCEIFANIGAVPDGGATYLLPRIVGLGRAFELITTCKMVDAQEAERIGLVNMLVPNDQLEKATMDLAARFAAGPTMAFGLIKKNIYRGLAVDFTTELDYEAHAQCVCLQSDDVAEGISAFLEKRKPAFTGK